MLEIGERSQLTLDKDLRFWYTILWERSHKPPLNFLLLA